MTIPSVIALAAVLGSPGLAVYGQGARNIPARSVTGAARVNLTGTWSSDLAGGPDLKLFQRGDLVWGKDHLDEAGIRGFWSNGHLTLVYTESVVDQNNPGCGPRTVLLMRSRGTATRLEGIGFDLGNGNTGDKYLTRNSPDAGPDFQYPYDQELKRCGQVFAWELVFETDSDRLQGTDWPVLSAVAAVLKQDPGLKIKVAGHTDSTGDPGHNQELSLRRAESVKKAFVDKYGADGSRIQTQGWGSEQPLVPNDTEDGRAINRRVEILVAH